MSLKQRKIKFEPRLKLNHNIHITKLHLILDFPKHHVLFLSQWLMRLISNAGVYFMRFTKIKGQYPFLYNIYLLEQKISYLQRSLQVIYYPEQCQLITSGNKVLPGSDIFKKNSMKIKTTTLLQKRESNFNRLTARMFWIVTVNPLCPLVIQNLHR